MVRVVAGVLHEFLLRLADWGGLVWGSEGWCSGDSTVWHDAIDLATDSQ